MTNTRILIIAGIALLAVVAVLGWVRNTQTTAPQTSLVDPLVNPAVNPAPVNSPSNYVEEEPGYGFRPAVRTISPVNQPNDRGFPYADRPAYPDRSYYEQRRPREFRRERSFGHSAAIVGGSAGTGAAIGAIAGGGKGAGIGALAGGGAGFVYDRLTHKKQEPAQ